MVLWQWEVWRCFDDAREALTARGWRLPERAGDEVMPLAAESGRLWVVFLGPDSGTGECLFELRDEDGPPAVILRGAHNLPTPEAAADLIADRGAELSRASAPRDRSLYGPAASATRVR